jgi:hypothetical protein
MNMYMMKTKNKSEEMAVKCPAKRRGNLNVHGAV